MATKQCSIPGCVRSAGFVCPEHMMEVEQNTALQANNTKLVLEKREVEKQLAVEKRLNDELSFGPIEIVNLKKRVRELEQELERWRAFEWTDIADNVGELEQDGKRLDWLQEHIITPHDLWNSGQSYWIADHQYMTTSLRQAVDAAMAWENLL